MYFDLYVSCELTVEYGYFRKSLSRSLTNVVWSENSFSESSRNLIEGAILLAFTCMDCSMEK